MDQTPAKGATDFYLIGSGTVSRRAWPSPFSGRERHNSIVTSYVRIK